MFSVKASCSGGIARSSRKRPRGALQHVPSVAVPCVGAASPGADARVGGKADAPQTSLRLATALYHGQSSMETLALPF